MGETHRSAGVHGEDIAAWYLRGHGCEISHRNIHVGPDEIDLVIRDDTEWAAVEVKYTRGAFDPLDAVDDAKIDRIRRAAAALDVPIRRVDLVGIADRGSTLEVRWLRAVR